MQCRSKQSKLSALKKTYIGRTLVDKSNHVQQHAKMSDRTFIV